MPKQVDLGCSSFVRGWEGYDCWGVDYMDHSDPKIKKADLVIDPIPFGDNEFDLATAYDFLEHIPPLVYLGRQRREPIIEFFNEVYRVLKPDGVFYPDDP